MLRLGRMHDSGTQVLLKQYEDGWRINIDLRESNHNSITITGYFVPTVERAKEVADEELRKYGHVCNGSCNDWIEFSSGSRRITHETRCEKCAGILGTHYEDGGVSWSAFHERLKITTVDKSQNRFGLCCPNCDHTTHCILMFVP
jgi:hypothetical protein